MEYYFEQWKHQNFLKLMGLLPVEQRFSDMDIMQVAIDIKREKQLADLRKAYEEKLAATVVTPNAAE